MTFKFELQGLRIFTLNVLYKAVLVLDSSAEIKLHVQFRHVWILWGFFIC